jgi:hypothetical protein
MGGRIGGWVNSWTDGENIFLMNETMDGWMQ